MRLICSFKACTRKLLVDQNWKEGLKNVPVFAVDKEIEKTTTKSQLHSTRSERWQYLFLT